MQQTNETNFIIILLVASIWANSRGQTPTVPARHWSVGLYPGYGKDHKIVSGMRTPAGEKITKHEYNIYGVRAVGKYYWSERNAIGLDLGYTIGYSAFFWLDRKTASSGEIASTPIASHWYPAAWHLIANYHRTILKISRWTLNAYVGTGVQLVTSNDYNTESVAYPSTSPAEYNASKLPPDVQKNPIMLFDAGLDMSYRVGKHGFLSLQPYLTYATKPFMTQTTLVKTTSYNHELKTSMTGTHAILSLGYSYRF